MKIQTGRNEGHKVDCMKDERNEKGQLQCYTSPEAATTSPLSYNPE